MNFANESKSRTNLALILLALGFLICLLNFCIQMWEVGFTTADDTAAVVMEVDGFWKDYLTRLWNFSERVAYFPSAILNYLRALTPPTQFWFRTYTLVPVLVATIVFGWFSARLFANSYIGIASAFLLLASYQHGWYHHSLTAFPLNFHLAFIFCILGFTVFHKAWLENSTKGFLLSGALGSFPVLMYEMFIVHLLIFPLLILFIKARYKVPIFEKQRLIRVLGTVTPTALSSAVVASYHLDSGMQTAYGGTRIDKFSPEKYFDALYVFTTSAFPGRLFRHYYSQIPFYLNVEKYNGFEFFELFDRMRLVWIAIPLTFIGFGVGCYYWRKSKLNPATHISLLAISFVMLYAPNVLICLTAAHQGRALSGVEITYSGTHFAVFGVVLLLLTIFNIIVDYTGKAAPAILLVLCLGGAIRIYQNQISNSVIANYQSISYAKWKLLEEHFSSNSFEGVNSEKDVIISVGMLGSVGDPFWGLFHPDGWAHRKVYWQRFSEKAFGTKLPIVQREHCEIVFDDCKKRNQTYLFHHVDWRKKTALLHYCPEDEISNSCTTKSLTAWF